MPHREDRILVIAPGSWSTKVTFGLSESLLPPSHTIPTRVFYDGKRYMLKAREDEASEEIWPIKAGRICYMTPFLAFLQLVIRKSTKIPLTPVALVVDTEWTTREREIVAKMLFERCEVGGLTMLDDALCGLLAFGKTEGVVINVGHEKTEISAYSDSLLQSRILLPEGSTTISHHLHKLLPHLSREQIEALKESPIVEIPVASRTGDEGEELDMAKIIARGKTKEYLEGQNGKPQPNVLQETNTFTFAGEAISVGRERFHAGEILFNDIATAYGLAVSKIDVDRREYVRENLVVIGGGAKIRGWRDALLSFLLAKFASIRPSQTPSSAMPSQFPTPSATGTSTPVPLPQPAFALGSGIRLLKLPDYFVEWKDAPPEDAAFLGAQICARVVFVTDAGSRGYVSREDYSDRGPRSITTVS